MTDEMLSKILSSDLNQYLGKNEHEIINALYSVLPDGKRIDPELEKLLVATVHISAQASLQAMVRSLEQAGIFDLPPEGTPILYPLNEE